MNKIYKTVWNSFRQCLVVVSEAMTTQLGGGRAQSAKVGLVGAVAATGLMLSGQAGAESIWALEGLDSTEAQTVQVEFASDPADLKAFDVSEANNRIFYNTVAKKGTMKDTVTFADADYGNTILKDSDRITNSMGFMGISGFKTVEVSSGHHLVLVGEASNIDSSEKFVVLDGDLIVSGNGARVSLGSYATGTPRQGTLQNIYVGVNPNDLTGTTSSGLLEVRNGQYSAQDVYNGRQIIIGSETDNTSKLKVKNYQANTQSSELQNYGIFEADTVKSGAETWQSQIVNHGQMTVNDSFSLNGFFDNLKAEESTLKGSDRRRGRERPDRAWWFQLTSDVVPVGS